MTRSPAGKALSALTPNPKNPRRISPEKLKMLERSLAEFGDLSGIVFNRRTRQLVGGHQRAKALPPDAQVVVEVKHRKPTKAGTVADGYVLIRGERFVYREVDWDETREKAANIAANQHGGDWDLPALAEWMTDLEVAGFDLDLTGFDADERAKMKPAPAGTVGKTDPDEIPEPPKVAKVKRGDVFHLGRHRLVCGDSTDADAWAAIQGEKSSTMVFTSPPYGVGENARIRDKYVRGAAKAKSLYNAHEDAPDAWPQLMKDWTGQALAHSELVICNVQMLANNKRHLMEWQAHFAQFIVDIAIWDKSHGPPQMQRNVLTNAFEFLYLMSPVEGASRSVPLADFHGSISNVARVGKQQNNEFAAVHKATMPIELVEWAIALAPRAKHIIDPFGGTGTTMIAAEKHGCSSGLIELDPIYCAVILDRWEKFTGDTAYLVGGGGSKTPWSKVKGTRAEASS